MKKSIVTLFILAVLLSFSGKLSAQDIHEELTTIRFHQSNNVILRKYHKVSNLQFAQLSLSDGLVGTPQFRHQNELSTLNPFNNADIGEGLLATRSYMIRSKFLNRNITSRYTFDLMGTLVDYEFSFSFKRD